MQSPPFPRYLVPPRSKYSPQHHVLKHIYNKIQGDTKNGNFWKPFQTIIVFVKHFYGESTLLTVHWSMITRMMARLSVAQGPCSVVLLTVHGCHYAFQMFPFFCVTLYIHKKKTSWISVCLILFFFFFLLILFVLKWESTCILRLPDY